ncbi:MAG: glycosyltransferase [Candidatus Micrarchaeota archaeon]
MGRPKVSIIVPEKNGSKYIVETIESIMAQDFEGFECIILDNASTDDTVGRIRRVIGKDGRFRLLVHEKDIGYVANLNAGLLEAKGEYIAYLHADDLWDGKFLSSSVSLLEGHPDAAMSFCRFENIDTNSKKHPVPPKNAFEGASRKIGKEELFQEYMKRDFTPVCTIMVRKSVQDEVGDYDPQFPGPCDYQMWLKISHSHPGVYNSQSASRYRIHGQSGTGPLHERGILLIEQYSMICKLFDSLGGGEKGEAARKKMLENTAWAALGQAFKAIGQKKAQVCRRKCGIAMMCYPSLLVGLVAAKMYFASYFTFILAPLARFATARYIGERA